MSRLKRKVLVRILATDLQSLAAIIWGVMLIVVIPVLLWTGILRWDPGEQWPWFLQVASVVVFLVGLTTFLGVGIVLAHGISQMAAKHFRHEFQVLYESFRRKVDGED